MITTLVCVNNCPYFNLFDLHWFDSNYVWWFSIWTGIKLTKYCYPHVNGNSVVIKYQFTWKVFGKSVLKGCKWQKNGSRVTRIRDKEGMRVHGVRRCEDECKIRKGERRGDEGMGDKGVVEVERAVWEWQYASPWALLLPSLATMVSWETDQRLGVIWPAHSCHTVTTTGRPRDTDTDRGTERERGRENW